MNLSEKFACNRVVAILLLFALLISGVLVTGTLGATQANAIGGGRTFEVVPSQGVVTWTVPEGVTTINFDIRGGGGGASNNTAVTPGESELGKRATGSFAVTPGEKLSLVAGGQGNAPVDGKPGTGGQGFAPGLPGSADASGEFLGGGGGGSSAITINDGDDTFIAGGGNGVNGSVQPDPALGGAGGNFGVLGGSNFFGMSEVQGFMSAGFVYLTYKLPPAKTTMTVDLQPSSGHEIDGDPVAYSPLDAAIEVVDEIGDPVRGGIVQVTDTTGKSYGAIYLGNNGQVTYPFQVTEAGPKTFNFAYAPNSPSEYETSVATVSVNVRKVNVRSTVTLPSAIISAADPFNVEADFNFGANYKPVPQGMTAFLHANPTESRTTTPSTKTWSAVIGADGAASFEVSQAPGDGWFYWTELQEDPNFEAGASDLVAITLGQLKPTLEVTVSPSTNLEYGKAGWVTATLKSPRKDVEPTGSVAIYLDGVAQPEPDRYVDYWSGDVHFTLELPLNAVGEYEIKAEYAGDTNFLAASGVTTSYLVSRAQVPTVASHGALGNTDSYIYGEPINLWSVMPGVPVNFAGEQGTQEFFVQRQGTQGSRLSVGTGGLQTASFPYFLEPLPEEVWKEAAFLWSTAAISDIPVGTWDVTADFHGNENLLPWVSPNDSEGTQLFSPVRVTQAETATVITAPVRASFNEVTPVVVTVSPIAPSAVTPVGDVEVYVNGELLQTVPLDGPTQDGQALTPNSTPATATVNIPTNQLGSFAVTATYVGNENHAGSQSTEGALEVVAAKTAVELTAAPTVVNVGKETTFTATIGTEGERANALLAPTGTVEFFVNGESLGDPVETLDGQAQQTWTGTSVGNYLVTAQFTAADQNYLGSNSEQLEVKVGTPWTPITPSLPVPQPEPTPSPTPTDKPSPGPKPTGNPTAGPQDSVDQENSTDQEDSAETGKSALAKTGSGRVLAIGGVALTLLLAGLVAVTTRRRTEG